MQDGLSGVDWRLEAIRPVKLRYIPIGHQKSNMGEEEEKVPKGIRFVIRVWGTFSALCISITGLFVMITLTATCLAMGIYQVCCGGLILPLEAPILCSYFPLLVKLSDWVESHFKFWMRAFLYLGVSLPPFFLCSELSTFLGSGSVLITAALYGVLAIGRKGADAQKSEDVEMRAKLVDGSGEANEESGL